MSDETCQPKVLTAPVAPLSSLSYLLLPLPRGITEGRLVVHPTAPPLFFIVSPLPVSQF